MFGMQKEELVEVEEIKKEIDDEHAFDLRMECFEECKLDSESEDVNDLLCRMFDG